MNAAAIQPGLKPFSQPTKIEYAIFALAVSMVSGAISGLYLKLFEMLPPAPVQAIEAPILLLMLLVAAVRLRATLLGALSAFPFMLLAGLAILSYNWSWDPVTSLSEALIFTATAIYLVSVAYVFSWRQILHVLWAVLLGWVIVSFILYLAVPSLARMSEIHVSAMAGVWVEKNAAGQIGTFGALIALARAVIAPKKMTSSIVSFFVFIAFLLASTSKTSLVALLFGISLFGWVMIMRRNMFLYLIVGALTLLVVVPLTYMVQSQTETVLQLLGRNATFTGRTEIWKAVQISVADQPRLGHGFAAYWSDGYAFGSRHFVFQDLGFEPNHAHNSWLEMSLDLGYIGRTLLNIALGMTAFFALIKLRISRGVYFIIPFLGAALLIASFESIFVTASNLGGALIILTLAKSVQPTSEMDAKSGLHDIGHWISSRSRQPHMA